MSTTSSGPTPSHPNTAAAADDRVPRGERLAFGVACLFRGPGLHGINTLAYPIFNVALGVSPVLIGFAIALFRLWDAVTDPLMGVISDNSKNARGRRRPYILVGAVVASLLFPAVFWVPRGWGEYSIFAYFVVTCLAYFTAFTVFATPLWALAFERTSDPRERTILWSYNSFFAAVGGMMMGWVYRFTQSDRWTDTVEGIRYVSLAIGAFWLICGILPALVMRERFRGATLRQPKIPLIRGLKDTLTCRPFMLINGVQLALLIGSNLVNFLGFYLNVYYVHGGDTKAASVIVGLQATVVVALQMIVIPLIPALTARFGKVRLMQAIFAVFMLVSLLKWVLITPDAPLLQLAVAIGINVPNAIFWTLAPAMVSDTCDWDELKTHQRREGLFSSVDQWINKLGVGLSSACTGAILVATGFSVDAGGQQAPDTLFAMRVLYSVVPIAFYLLAAWFLARYPIDERTAAEVRAELQRRRQAET